MATATKKKTTFSRRVRTSEPAPEIYQLLNSMEFHRKTHSRQWLIEPVFTVGEPAVIAGPRKCLKTHVALDAAISISSGNSFLGEFEVPEARRVAVFSGEMSDANLHDAACRIAESKELFLPMDCDIFWSIDFPQLGREEARTKLTNTLKAKKIQVVLIDPLYLCLLDEDPNLDPGDLRVVGPVIRRLAESCLAAGATPIFVHTTTESTNGPNSTHGSNEPPTLDGPSWSGIGDVARQWLLLARRNPNSSRPGINGLKMVAGGDAGHSGIWNVEICLGTMDSDFGNRRWEVFAYT